MKKEVLLIATFDTKGEEALYFKSGHRCFHFHDESSRNIRGKRERPCVNVF
jgi:hypothetical protein